jgi:pyruvate formate lyase activating enzyme
MVNGKKTGIVFDIQSFSTHDGPGIRTNIFLKGCPLRCLWCCNPEGQQLLPEVFYVKSNCVGCLSCEAACPRDAITPVEVDGKRSITIDRRKCKTCDSFECINVCPNNALQRTGKLMTVEEVMKVIRRDEPFYRQNGGVTLSGGDALTQHEFALEILKACKAMYIRTAMETELLSSFDCIRAVFPYVDFFMCDLKVFDETAHIRATGVSNQLILENFEKMAAMDASKILVRIPIIPDLTDSEENVTAIAQFCHTHGLNRINILPYHRLGEAKYEKLHRPYPMPEAETPSSEKMNRLKELIEAQQIVCIIN